MPPPGRRARAGAAGAPAAPARGGCFRPCIDIHQVRPPPGPAPGRAAPALGGLGLAAVRVRAVSLPAPAAGRGGRARRVHPTACAGYGAAAKRERRENRGGPTAAVPSGGKLTGARAQGTVKQIVGATLRSDAAGNAAAGAAAPVENFVATLSAGDYARRYAADGLRGGHIIMLGADPASRAAAFEALEAFPGGMQVGGGVTPANAAEYLDAGASHVIVTSYVFEAGELVPEKLAALVAAVGRDRLVLDLSCRRKEEAGVAGEGAYFVATDRWQRFTALEVNAATLEALGESCDEFLVHGVDVEGLQQGIEDDLVALLGRHSPRPVTYAGGVRSLADCERIRTLGGGRVSLTVGSALDIFGGALAYDDVVAWGRRQPDGA